LDSVRASIWDSVRASIWDSVGYGVWASIRDSVHASVRDSVGRGVWDSVRDSVYGNHDAGWLSFYATMGAVVGVPEAITPLRGLMELAKSAGWALPHKEICWVSERHNVLRRDDRGRLHAEDGPAVMYPDGWAIYAVHGVRVPADIIEDRASITVERIEKEDNAEIRRVMISLYGEGQYLEDSGAVVVSEYAGGRLYRKDAPEDEPIVMVRVINSTPEPDGTSKVYWLRVPPDMADARAAVAWTFGMDAHEYQPAQES